MDYQAAENDPPDWVLTELFALNHLYLQKLNYNRCSEIPNEAMITLRRNCRNSTHKLHHCP